MRGWGDAGFIFPIRDWRAADKAQREQEAAALARQQAIAEQVRALVAEVEERMLRAIDAAFDDALAPVLGALRETARAGSEERAALVAELRGCVYARAAVAALCNALGSS